MGSMPAPSNRGLRSAPTRVTLERAHGRAGFTLIELVVVLVLIGITMAVVVPAIWQASTSDTANTLAAPVVSLLRYAQRTAAQQNDVVTVGIDPSTNAYEVRAARTDSVLAAGHFAFASAAHFLADSARLRVMFKPAGGADADSLVLSDANGIVDVRIDPWSGTIDVAHR